jgi:hypothetical protein
MQFIITAYDGVDENAINRRLAVRENHIKLLETLVEEKKHLYIVILQYMLIQKFKNQLTCIMAMYIIDVS